MLVIFEKTTQHLKAIFSNHQTIEVIYMNSPEVLDRLDGIHIDKEYIPSDDITNYKLVGNEIVKIPIDEFQAPIANPLEEKINLLTTENNQFKQLLNLVPPISNPITLEEYKKNKVFELSISCNQHILNGFYSDCRGGNSFYSFSELDQTNIMGYISMLNIEPETQIIWKSADETICTPFTKEQMTQLAKDGLIFKQENIYKFETLRNQVIESTSIEQVVEIVW